MPEAKYKLTSRLSHLLQEVRNKKGISASKLSKDIGNSVSYISALENGNIKSMKESDFINIVKILYDINNDDEAKQKIQNLIANSEDDSDVSSISDLENEEDSNIPSQENIKTYKTIDTIDNQKEFKRLIKIMNSGFTEVFKHDSKFAERELKSFIRSMRFDLGFMMAIIGIPFFTLSKLNHDERQNLYDEVSDVFKKYYEMIKDETDTDAENTQRTDD
ncbi:helix-turn-helix domain-containing protein [Caproiciproducens sp. CPB-2]|uniref:helix-turn-helix domain-containing protein n=1 Tax=Caproiciproducens sp. CPB-2 TaxID=3030017 RepID=UPI0023DAAFF9|nr:helix-turn-helix transcriptional regulator [Caproiciproducens sp. CPB-2]MDF1496314.1 helix-turn-helix transcriptional regulator [Caproiciproducens sp. CPB-2]